MREPVHVTARLGALKAATAEAHQRAEATGWLARLTRPDVTLADYGIALQRLHLHFATHEPAILQSLQAHIPAAELARRETVAALRADLADLGLAVLPVLPSLAPLCPARAAGWLYVHEGASLGGLLVLRHLRDHLGAALGTATRHYFRYGKATAARWQDTRRLIADQLPDEAALRRAVAGAEAAFAALAATMSEPTDAPVSRKPGTAPQLCPHAQGAGLRHSAAD